MPQVGDRVGRYSLVGELGVGGMGRVFRAQDTQLQRLVALKVLLVSGEGRARQQLVARMLREARAAAAFSHPNAVGIYDIGESEGMPFLVMELVAGKTLRSLLEETPAPWPRRVGWLVDVARALAAAHRAGLVHRDIKPDNVMVRDEDGTAKVLDFGIARTAAGVDVDSPTASPGLGTLTEQGGVVGTPLYMAPEQVRHAPVDARTDQFAWGVTAYELLAGKLPWGVSDVYGLVAAILDAEPPPLRELCPELPEAVADVVHRALQKKPEDRYASMANVADALAPFVGTDPGVRISPPAERAAEAQPDPALASTALASVSTPGPPEPAKRRRRGMAVVAVGLGVASLGFVGTKVATLLRGPHTIYCAEMNPSRTGPRCGVQMTPEKSQHWDGRRRVTLVGGRVTRVEADNTTGRASLDGDRDDVLEYAYEGERPVSVIARERHGRFLWRCNYSASMVRADCTGEDGLAPHPLPDSDVTQIHYDYDVNGFVSEERFFGLTGKPRQLHGAYGLRRERRADGMVTRYTTLGADGQPAAGADGVCWRSFELDASGLSVAESYFACDGSPATRRWAHKEQHDRDAWGGIVMTRFYDSAGAPAAGGALSGGSYAIADERNSFGHLTKRSFLDAQGRPARWRREGFAFQEIAYDDHQRTAEMRWLDVDHNLVLTLEGQAKKVLVWDEHDDQREEYAVGLDGQRTVRNQGWATRKTDFDARGRLIRVSHYDDRGNPVPWIHGAAVEEHDYDERDVETAIRLLDGSGKPVVNENGVAYLHGRENELGERVRLWFGGLRDEPVLGAEGCAAFAYAADADGNVVASSCTDVSGSPAYLSGEYTTTRWKYDERGLILEKSVYDAHDNPTLTKAGYATVRFSRDRSGDVVFESYLGDHGNPVANKDGYAKILNTYDVRRRLIEAALFDVAGAPVTGVDGWSVEKREYDARGLVTRIAHLDPSGHPVLTKSHGAAIRTTYDDRGNALSVTTEGVDGKPTLTAEGFATRQSRYDERDLLSEETLFGTEGKPVLAKAGWATHHLRYDAVGDLVEEGFLGETHRLIVAKDPPYASLHIKYDARRRAIERAFFDAEGSPMKGPDGAEVIRLKPDAYGRTVEMRYLDATGAPATSKDGKQLVKTAYDDGGRPVSEEDLDAAENPKLAADGCAGHRTKYDDRGRKIEEACVDEKGATNLSKERWAIRTTQYDARGNVVDESTRGPDRSLHADESGIARRHSRFDERSRKLAVDFFDATDRPAADRHGVAGLRYRYDETGKALAETRVDLKGAAVPDVGPRKPAL